MNKEERTGKRDEGERGRTVIDAVKPSGVDERVEFYGPLGLAGYVGYEAEPGGPVEVASERVHYTSVRDGRGSAHHRCRFEARLGTQRFALPRPHGPASPRDQAGVVYNAARLRKEVKQEVVSVPRWLRCSNVLPPPPER